MNNLGIFLGGAVDQRNNVVAQQQRANSLNLQERTFEFQQQMATQQQNTAQFTEFMNGLDGLAQTAAEVTANGGDPETILAGGDEQIQFFVENLQASGRTVEAQRAVSRWQSMRAAVEQTSTPTQVASIEGDAAAEQATALRDGLIRRGVPEPEANRAAGLLSQAANRGSTVYTVTPETRPVLAELGFDVSGLPDNFVLEVTGDGGIQTIFNPASGGGGNTLTVGADGSFSFGPSNGGMTTSEQSARQENYRQGNQLIANLSTLRGFIEATPDAVGVAGNFGELMNSLSQFNEAVYDDDIATARSLMRSVSEASLRVISSDDRFSNIDREYVMRLFPGTGIFESPQNALAKISVLQSLMVGELIRQGYGIDANVLSPENIRDYQRRNLLTRDEAIQALQQIHPEEFNQ